MNPISVEQAMQIALDHHNAGRLAQAEPIYRQVLAQFPDHADALHLLGYLALQVGQYHAAIDLIGRAVTIDPSFAAYHCNLGESYRRTAQWVQAIASLRRAIELAPGMTEAHNNLGVALREAGRLDEAIAAFTQAIQLQPSYAWAHSNLGIALKDSNRLIEALAAYDRAIALEPEMAEAHSNRGNILRDLGRLDEAIFACTRAIALKPDMAEAHCNLGNALKKQGRLDEALAAYTRAIALKPDMAEAHSNQGDALRDQGRLDEAIDACTRAISLRHTYAEAYGNLGNALKDKGRLDEAIEAHRRAIELKPTDTAASVNLGAALVAQGDLERAIRVLEHALEQRPNHFASHSGMLMCKQYQTGVTPASLALAHAEWEQRHAARYRESWKPWELDRDPDRPLRLGFVSPDLRRHAVGLLSIRALENLDRRAFNVICYYGHPRRDDLSDRFARTASEWHDVVGLSDDDLAGRIRADRIDIAFDLSGHTAEHRLLVFARRPAPIQISWIGYVGTTGLTAMDYLLADRFHVPPGAELHYREAILRMPDGYVCYEPPATTPPVGPLPAIERGYVTFGCFNNIAKVSPDAIALWAEIVRQVPGSRLLLVSGALGSATVRERIRRSFFAAGGDCNRLELRGALPWLELLAAYNTIDVALDPFPYSGGLTTCEALWMGVPVITWPGETFAGRHSLSHLSNVGMTETIAADVRGYVECAVRLAGALPYLATLRAGLRERMARSPLCDGERFAQHMMALLRDVWRQWCHR